MPLVDGLIFGYQKNLDYGQRLIADLNDEQLVLQPAQEGKPANHPAWIYSHLNVYAPIIRNLILGETFDDPKPHRFGMQSHPESDASIYPSQTELLSDFVKYHNEVLDALKDRGDACLDQPMTLERWKEPMPTVGIALPYLMLVHENQHFGQVSAWRRVLGLPAV